MAVKVLGPLDTGPQALSPRERVIFSALVLNAGYAVEPAQLADACWGDSPPPTWRQQVKTSIARIRARLGRDAIVTQGSRYRLGVDAEAIDTVRFEHLVAAAREHTLAGEHSRAVDSYRRAMALWRGAPYADLALWAPGVAEAMRLAEIRTSIDEELLDARLNAGDHYAVIADAERLVRIEPLREDRWAVLALANYRSGRQAEALAVLRAARQRLADELGIGPGARLTELESAILRQDTSLSVVTTAPASTVCPYRGLRAYAADDADDFFGRDADVDALLGRVRPGATVAVVGAPGSGKSSVMLAGVLPHLVEGGHTIRVVQPRIDAVRDLSTAIERGQRPDVLAVDQAEAMMQLPPRDLKAFCAILASVPATDGVLMLTLRSDFIDAATALPHVGAGIGSSLYALGPLSVEGLRAAIEEPARRAGLRLEPGLTELVLRDAGDRRSTLPHVSHALVETWTRREGTTLTVAGYEASGGIAGAIAQSAEAMYRSLAPEEQALCRSLLLRLVMRGADGASVRRLTVAEPLLADPARRALIERLVDARLLTSDGESILVAHEAVATAWPRLDGWLDEDAAGARLTTSVSAAAETWNAAGRPEEDLLRGARLQAALEWRERADPDLTLVESAYLDASAERHQIEARALARRAEHDRRQNRRLRWALGGAAVLLVATLAAGGVAVVRGADAAASSESALRAGLVSTSLALRDSDRDVAALLAAESYLRWPDDPASRAALMGSMTAADGYIGSIDIPDATGRVGTALIPDTRSLVVARPSGALEIRDVNTMSLQRTLEPGLPPAVRLVRPWTIVSRDGSTLAVFREIEVPDGESDTSFALFFYDLRRGVRIGKPMVLHGYSDSVAISDDGTMAAWVESITGDVSFFDARTHGVRTIRELATVPPTGASAGVPVFTATGALIVGSGDGTLLRVDPKTLNVEEIYRLPPESANTELVLLDDGTVIAAGHKGMARFDPAHGRTLWQQRLGVSQYFECSRIVVSRKHGALLCTDQNGTIERRDLETGALQSTLRFEGGWPAALYLLDDEDTLMATPAQTAVVSRWRIDGGGPVARVIAPGLLLYDGYDPTGHYVIAAGVPETDDADGAPTPYSVWDTRTGERVFDLPGGDPPMWDALWIGRDRLIVYQEGADDPDAGVLRIFDIRTGAAVDPGDITADMLEFGVSPRTGAIYGVFRTDGATPSYRVEVFDPETLRRTGQTLEFGTAAPSSPSFTPDGTRVAFLTWSQTADPWETRVFDTETGELIARGMHGQLGSVITPSGELVGASERNVAVFAGSALERTRALPRAPGSTEKLEVSRDGETLLAWNTSALPLALYDLRNGERLGDSLARTTLDWGTSAHLRPDGEEMAYSSAEGIVVWDLDPAHQFAAACRIAGRELTADEWHTYLRDLGPQRKTCSGVLPGTG